MNILVHTITGLEATIHVCNYLLGNAHETLQEDLERIDVINKLQYAQALLHRLNNRCKNHYTCMTDPSHPVVVAASGLIDSVHTIRKDLNTLHQECNNHQRSWLKHFYTPSYNTTLERLNTHVTIHDLRVNRLIHVLPLLQQDDSINLDDQINTLKLTANEVHGSVDQKNNQNDKTVCHEINPPALHRSHTWS